MPKSLPAHRLLTDNYPFQLPTETRYSDLDSYAHLNNGSIGRFYENARARMHLQIYQRDDFFHSAADEKVLLVDCHLRYLHEGHFPAPVVVTSGIGRIGRTSYDIHQAVFQHGKCIGLCDATMVRTFMGTPSPIEGRLLAQFEQALIKVE
jgi:acyl-CoA thioester hydrolase